MKKNVFLAYALIWFAVSAAVIIGMVITKNPNCLWAFIIPCFVKPEIWKNDDKKIWCGIIKKIKKIGKSK